MVEMLEGNHKNINFLNTNLHIQFQTVLIQEFHQEILDTADWCPLNVKSRDSETRAGRNDESVGTQSSVSLHKSVTT